MKNDVKTSENVADLEARIVELEALVKYYEELLRLQKHKQFGASSEKSEYDQYSLFNEAENTANDNILEPELVEIQKHFRKRTRLVNDRLPDNLPVETIEYDLDKNERICPECDGDMHVMGRETRKELKIVPAQAVIVEHIRRVS